MAAHDAHQRAREVARLADELTVRLRVLEEGGGTSHLRADMRPIGSGEDVGGSIATNDEALVDGDIMAVAFIVMMEAATSAREDLKAIVEGVESITAARHRLLAEVAKAPADGSSTGDQPGRQRGRADLDAVLEILLTTYGTAVEQDGEQLLRDLDSTSELGELESLRLQMAMDRMNKLMSTLSNLLKKIADTNQRIVQNLK